MKANITKPRKPISARQVIEPTKPIREPAGSIAAELRRNTAGTDDCLGEPASNVRSGLVVRTIVTISGQREPEISTNSFSRHPYKSNPKQGLVAIDRPPNQRETNSDQDHRHRCGMYRNIHGAAGREPGGERRSGQAYNK